MTDIYLKAETEAAAIAALAMTPLYQDGQWVTVGDGWALCRADPVVTTLPVVADDGMVTAAAVVDPAFHINVRTTKDVPWMAAVMASGLVVTPVTPSVVWFG